MRQTATIKRLIAKALNAIGLAVATATMCIALPSCDGDNDDFPIFPLNRPNAIVTVKPSGDGTTFNMQLDDSTTISASNMKTAPYGNREVRAFVNFKTLTPTADKRSYEVYVNWIDSILTKPMAYMQTTDANATPYRQDPVELLRDWTVAEDGYLTIHFRTLWAANGTAHCVNLAATNPSNPYELTFFHDAQGVKGGYWGDGIVAFRLDRLPDTKGKTVDITLRWMSFSGARSVTFRYSPRRSTGDIEGLCFAQSGQFEKAIR